jgi:hypothetical protein
MLPEGAPRSEMALYIDLFWKPCICRPFESLPIFEEIYTPERNLQGDLLLKL